MEVKELNNNKWKPGGINFLSISLIVFLALFEAHINKISGWDSLPLIEGALCGLLILAFANYLFRRKMRRIELLSYLFIVMLLITGAFKQSLAPLILGIFFISKPFIAFIGGLYLPISNKQTLRVLKAIGILSIFTIAVSILQYAGFPFNPFGFSLNSSGVIGIFDNPNKNAQIMVYGYLILSNFPKSIAKSLLLPIFFIGILATGSRQGLIFFLLLVFLMEVVMKKRWYMIWTTVPVIAFVLIYYADQLLMRFFNLAVRIQTGEYFRLKAVIRSFELLWEHPLFGTGAGSFGGTVAYWYESPLQSQLWEHWDNYRFFPKTIDVYFPHLWAETGLLGLFFFVWLLYLILKPYYLNRKFENSSLTFMFLALGIFLFSFTSMALEASFFTTVIFLLLGANYLRISGQLEK